MDVEEWRLCYSVGGLTHYTAWCSDYDRIAALYEQYQRGAYASEVRTESRAVCHQSS
ncbi:hypothetical protein [Haloarcula salinisoli]|uniref:Uncharacterized protein n=1 Tax=Haloarcula salinisoli TaxID=2487746 RepID=A0A8J7YM86_9EURY|nr:hypothetical protein [Halomicroarcula salinisoli]MBX0288318.1 hypothetical protein [Halomicroarcula salinisoli]MBX0305799.1 hypothetical protein [Halomicroarcula salinisoli]